MKRLLSVTLIASFILVGCKPKLEIEILFEKIEGKIDYIYADSGFDFAFSAFNSHFHASAISGGEIEYATYNNINFNSKNFDIEYNILYKYTFVSSENGLMNDFCRVDTTTFETYEYSDVSCTNDEIEKAKMIKDSYEKDLEKLGVTEEELLVYMQYRIDTKEWESNK